MSNVESPLQRHDIGRTRNWARFFTITCSRTNFRFKVFADIFMRLFGVEVTIGMMLVQRILIEYELFGVQYLLRNWNTDGLSHSWPWFLSKKHCVHSLCNTHLQLIRRELTKISSQHISFRQKYRWLIVPIHRQVMKESNFLKAG